MVSSGGDGSGGVLTARDYNLLFKDRGDKKVDLLIILKLIPITRFIKIFNHVINYFTFINTLYYIIEIILNQIYLKFYPLFTPL